MKIYYNNLIEESTLSTSSTFDGYSVDNLKTSRLSEQYKAKFISTTINITFLEVKDIQSFIIDRGELSDSATVTLQGNSISDFTSPPFEVSLVKTDTCFYIDIDVSYQYFRLVIEDSVEPTFGYIHIGSKFLQMPRINPKVELFYNNTSEATISLSGQSYEDEGYEFLETNFDFPKIYEDNFVYRGELVANRQDILDMFRTIKSTTNQKIWVFIWSNDLDTIPPVFCILNQSKIKIKIEDEGEYSTSLNIREVK